MKERPIIFSAPMVRAILEGRKWQTRRVIKNMPPQPAANCHEDHMPLHKVPYFDVYCSQNKTECNPRGKGDNWSWWQVDNRQRFPVIKCPFGKPSDRLWVRETWQSHLAHEHLSPANIPIGSDIQYPATSDRWISKCRPSIHMPRWASRITLEIVDIHAERLQKISEEDAIAEGAQYFPNIPEKGCNYIPPRWSMKKPISTMDCLSSARMAFANFINELYGGENWNLKSHSLWDSNPWVWVIEFKRVKP